MFKRIARSLATFAAIFAAYQAYALVAVPWMEPPIKVRQSQPATKDDRERAAHAVTEYQLLLSNYFPKEHWSQARPPKVIATPDGDGMFVMDDFERSEVRPAATKTGRAPARVEINRFAVLLFPTPPRRGITPPRDAIILEAPQGATLEFDDFRPEAGHVGQITRGQFPGRIIIRSDMREPGPADDLLIETADLKMNTKLLYTSSPVRFRLGRNAGMGRELEMRFLADEHVQPQSAGLKLPGLDSLEIRREVRVRLQLDADSLLPGGKKKSSPDPAKTGTASQDANPPVEITCNGPFVFDFVRYRASVDRDVQLRQVHATGPSDQLTCNQLDIHFAPKAVPESPAEPVVADPRRRQQRDLGRLEPAVIIAEGHPVVVTSPARRAEARGDRIQIALRDQRVMISGGREVMLLYGSNLLRAPAIDYQHPAADAATTIGRFRANGPGSLFYVPDPTEPQQTFHASWQRSVELGRDKGQPTLVLEGRPRLAFADAGALVADRIKLDLRELQGSGPAAAGLGFAISNGGDREEKLQVVPDRLTATGRIEIDSPQLTGRTEELVTTFRMRPDVAGDDSPNSTAAVGKKEGSGTAGPLHAAPGVAPPPGQSQQAFHVDADRMQMEVELRGQSAGPSTVTCLGNVVFREVPSGRTQDQPLEIRGGQLTVDKLQSGTAHITLTGAGPGEPPGSKLAQLRGRGVTVLADAVELDQRDNRLWSNGPGKAKLLLTRDLDGQTSATPIPVEVIWQGGLQFDGRHVVFQKNVLVAGTDDTLRCDELSAKLTAAVQFGQSIDQQAIDLAEIECRGHVSIDHRSRDEAGITSHERLQLARLTINQQTGAISGDGPGVLRSTRFGDGLMALAGPQAGSPPPAASRLPNPGGSKLHFLRIDFQRELEGDLYTRMLSFRERVRTVYGPVDSWEQELDLARRESLPPESVTLLCDDLRVNEDALAARGGKSIGGVDRRPLGKIQLQAYGNVQIDGQTEAHGVFGALADRASYEQSKDVFLLEGSGRTPARLWLRRYPGEEVTPLSAERIRYDRATGLPKVERFQYLEITPGSLNNATRSGPVRQ